MLDDDGFIVRGHLGGKKTSVKAGHKASQSACKSKSYQCSWNAEADACEQKEKITAPPPPSAGSKTVQTPTPASPGARVETPNERAQLVDELDHESCDDAGEKEKHGNSVQTNKSRTSVVHSLK